MCVGSAASAAAVVPLEEWARKAVSDAETKFHDENAHPIIDPNTNQNTANQMSIFIAKEFLSKSSPNFLSSDLVIDSDDRLVKIGRSIADLVRIDQEEEEEGDDTDNNNNNNQNHQQLKSGLRMIVQQCKILSSNNYQVPKVRFGKTNIDMPILSIGCMRFQQTWSDVDPSKVEQACQDNVVAILKHAIVNCGINHIESARSYGMSDYQLGNALKTLFDAGVVQREDLTIQVKVNAMANEAFRKTIEKTMKNLQIDYIDLFSFHGLNMDKGFDQVFKMNGSDGETLMDVAKEYKAAGKIRHIGFSSHAQPEFIRKCIETNEFEYANIHYHAFGSYTASGGGEYGGNYENMILMKERDMGIFIISPYDKGGRLYAPSKKLRSLTLPDMEPIDYGTMWLYAHEEIDTEHHVPVHTFSIGVARPSDFDESVVAAVLFKTQRDEMLQKVKAIEKRLKDAEVEALGEDWVNTWYHGVPNSLTDSDKYQLGQIVSLYNMIKAWGMLGFAQDRYDTFDGNTADWDDNLSTEKNINKMIIKWGYMPGCSANPAKDDYSTLLSEAPEANRAKIMEAIEFMFHMCSKYSTTKPDIPKDCETAYDMRPWNAFPERK
jgi:predicted aldo/keto reductase-like oxidoreductase